MANYCFTKYAIEGKKEVLERVADAINGGEGWMKKSFENLGLKVDEDEYEYAYRAEWETGARVEDRDGVSVLFFRQAYPWEKIHIVADVLAQLGDKEAKIYYFIECSEDWDPQTNDIEHKYFPENYRVWTEKDEVYFITKEEAIAHIRKQYKLSDDYDTIEKIQELCDENDLVCGFNEIDRYRDEIEIEGGEE